MNVRVMIVCRDAAYVTGTCLLCAPNDALHRRTTIVVVDMRHWWGRRDPRVVFWC